MGRSPIEREFILSRWALATQLTARFPSSRQWVGFTWLNWKAIEGFRFSPTEPELINYLKSGEPGCREGFCIIPTLENITDFNPHDLRAKFMEKSVIPSNGKEWWFISPQTQSGRIPRKTPCGASWGITGQSRDITFEGKKIGSKKILAFPYDKGSKGSKSDWIIHEYHLPKDSPNPSGNNVLCHLMRKQDEKADNSTAGSDITSADVEQLLNQSNDEPVVQEGILPKLYTFSLPHLLQLLQREVESLSIRQSTNIGSSYGPYSYAMVQNGEEPDKSTELESSLRTTEENELADLSLDSDTEVRQETVAYAQVISDAHLGEEPRFKRVQHETAAGNIKDEAADRAKNGQIFTTENRRSKVKPPNSVFPPEETKGIPSSPFCSSGFSDFREFGGYFDQPADQEKGPDQEEHDLANGSPKKRKLNVSEENQIQ